MTELHPSASLVDVAYDKIRRRILDNIWPPGYRALEQEAALALGMSRTPVREALIRLQNEGLVELVPRHGMRVLPVSADDMRETARFLEEHLPYLDRVRFNEFSLIHGTPIADEGRNMWLAFPTLFDLGNPPRVPDAFRPSCHIFYRMRVIDVNDGLPKWSGHKEQSALIQETRA